MELRDCRSLRAVETMGCGSSRMETAGLVKVADELELQEQERNSWKDWQQLN